MLFLGVLYFRLCDKMVGYNYVFFLIGLTPSKVEQQLRGGMELQEKEVQKY